ncbi:DUF2512 family protein [Pseudobacteroides cellulosolvens]|uniref:DUF2512 family protein n=1 Tax=Pseudobacteroides cellulosolvens ATCC 35603 = DSM 2933 TaxID=398512 RepID=A0A0L6JQ53_9FIRM|nr:DUF2512 family protein [Pseudobacteroides cellulosolvens]KNY27971.1 Protein of unknown function DUF2512 [Pseudobacteroides cellulosolvens ATCC 35603 = DSM 2933]
MTGFIIKLFICPIILIISDALFNNVNYANLYQPIIIGLILAVLAHTMEVLLLRKGTLWTSNAVDFIASVIIVYITQFFLQGAKITFLGALFTSVLLSVTEYFQHLYLIKSGKWAKSSK